MGKKPMRRRLRLLPFCLWAGVQYAFAHFAAYGQKSPYGGGAAHAPRFRPRRRAAAGDDYSICSFRSNIYSDMALQPVKFGRYTLLGLVARGGMGEIYHARYDGVAGFEKTCIIKKIRREYARDKSFVDRFLDEGRLLVSLTHSNIVQIFDMGVVGGEYYLAMEYVDGADLRMLLRGILPNRVPVAIAIGVTLEALRGLSYAHRSKDSSGRVIGIVHGDVSPSNILISSEGEVKLIDFGIARPARTISPDAVVRGKHAYMSPEQARGEALDCRADIFSMGVVLFEMAAGRRPFGDNVEDMICGDSILGNIALSGEADLPDRNGEFDRILARALEPALAARYQTADDMFDALIEYARQYGIICGQKEIYAYFHPYIEEIEKASAVVGTADEVMSAALEAMIGMQSSGATHTRTLSPAPLPRREPDANSSLPDAIDVAPPPGQSAQKFEIEETDPKKSDIEINNNAQDAEFFEKSKSDLVAFSGADREQTDEILWDAPAGRRTRVRRALVRMRYIFIGIVVGICAIVGFILYRMSKAPLTAEEFRHTLGVARIEARGGRVDHLLKGARKTEQDETPARAAVPDEVKYVAAAQSPMTYGPIFSHARKFSRGVPFAFYTSPDEATIYIVEGVYRALEDKHFLLVAEEDTEVAIQAPGYETCFYRVHFGDLTRRSLDYAAWRGCESVESAFSARTGRMEIFAKLSPMRARRDGEQKSGILRINGDGDAKIQNIAGVDAFDADVSDKSEYHESDGAFVPTGGTESREKAPKLGRRAKETAEMPSDGAAESEVYAVSGQSNRAARLVSQGRSCDLPCTAMLLKGAPYEIRPNVSGRQIGIPVRGAVTGTQTVAAEFCRAAVRIQESYAPGDPSPYQAADIAADGRVYAQQTETATFILPCGVHDFEAHADTAYGRLSGRIRADLRDGAKSHVFSIALMPQP